MHLNNETRYTGILGSSRDKGRYEVSLSDTSLFIYRIRRLIGCVQRGKFVSNGMLAIAISAGTVIQGRHFSISTESGTSSYDLKLWKLYLYQNNFNFGASFGKL